MQFQQSQQSFLQQQTGVCVWNTSIGAFGDVNLSRCLHFGPLNTARVFHTCVGVVSEADEKEVRTEKLTVTFEPLGEAHFSSGGSFHFSKLSRPHACFNVFQSTASHSATMAQVRIISRNDDLMTNFAKFKGSKWAI